MSKKEVIVEEEVTTEVPEEEEEVSTEVKTSKIKEVAKKHGKKIGLAFGGAMLLGLGYILGRRSDADDSDIYDCDSEDIIDVDCQVVSDDK